MKKLCWICCPSRLGMPHDTNGCILEDGHTGPHQYVAENKLVTWEIDFDCSCLDCVKSDSFADNCLIYTIEELPK
jgi:hypothetical protein